MSLWSGRAADGGARGLLARRPELGAGTLVLLASLYFAAVLNGPFWSAMLGGRTLTDGHGLLWAGALFVALTAAHVLLLAPLANRWTVRPLLAAALVAAALGLYYMQRFGIYLDPSMMRNVLRTDRREAQEVLHLSLFTHLLLYGALPLLVLARVRVARPRLARGLLRQALLWLAALAALVLALLSVFQDFAAAMRNQTQARYLINPANIAYSLARVAGSDARAATRPLETLGADATLGPGWAQRRKPALVILVVGETARGANWQLNGYARATTPQLAARSDLINFRDVTSCGTNTEVSLPCMFSALGRRHYDEAAIRGSESLLHVVSRAGIGVRWRDNQSGCKGVCAGLPQDEFAGARVDELCDGERCLDGVLLEGLKDKLGSGSQLVVLHQLGNHGPAYWRRYPPAFRRFLPECATAELQRCSAEQIVNAYDNALLYTDELLARTIDFLQAQAPVRDTALVYVSDHGESLGENGLFLHGLPYAIAPREQTWVPMVMWFSPGYASSFGLDTGCLRQRAAQPASHDNLFHTVLGLLEVKSAVYDRALDLAAPCRR